MFVNCLMYFMFFFGSLSANNDFMSCTFGINELCGWKNDPGASDKWYINVGSYSWTRGYYLNKYFDGPRTPGIRSIRLISPLYNRKLESDACFCFSYNIEFRDSLRYHDKGTKIRVYQKPDYLALEEFVKSSEEVKKKYQLFEIWGDLGKMKWFNSVSTLKNFNSDFQIIIEGVTGSIRILMKIDDVALLRGSKCYAAKIAATTPAWLYLYETSTTSTTFVPSTTISTTTPTTPTTQTSKTTTTTTQRSFGVNDTLSCAFLNGDFCGWKNDLGAIDRWLSKDNYIYFDEPSWLGNSSVRLISPTYRSVLNSNGCFFFSYKMYTKSHSRSTVIRIYQKPDYVALEDLVEYSDEAKLDYIIYEIWGDLGDYWYDNISTLRKYDHKFQIIIEGIFGQDRMFMAIDDVSILQGSDCPKTTTTTTSTPTTPTTIETTDANTTTPMLATTQRQREETTTTTKTSTSTTPTINSTTTILILTTTQRQREDNNVDGVDLPTIAITLAVILVLVILVTVLTWKRSRTDSSNALWTYIVRKYGRRNNSEDTKAPGVEYSTKNAEVEISCNETRQLMLTEYELVSSLQPLQGDIGN